MVVDFFVFFFDFVDDLDFIACGAGTVVQVDFRLAFRMAFCRGVSIE